MFYSFGYWYFVVVVFYIYGVLVVEFMIRLNVSGLVSSARLGIILFRIYVKEVVWGSGWGRGVLKENGINEV